MATITTINASDQITNSRAVINTNFSNLNSDKIETSYIDTDTTLAANSDSKIATQKAVKAYVDVGGNVNASETSKGIVEEATDAEIISGASTGGTGAKLFVTPAKLKSGGVVKFGGTGADGAFSASSGTTNFDLGNAKTFEKNYTTFSLIGTADITFTNPHADGTLVIFRSQGNVTITTSATRAIDLRSVGGSAGAGWRGLQGGKYISASTYIASSNALYTGGAGGGNLAVGANGGVASAGAGAASVVNSPGGGLSYCMSPVTMEIYPGGGGSNGSGGTSGAGGAGGGALLIECGGALNITGTIDASGANGANAGGNPGSGGGGGAGGSIMILYATLTANTGTYTVTAGTGGTLLGAGVAGGNGSIGQSLVAANIWKA